VWVDTDPGLGLPFVDVDDAIAIHALLAAGVPVAGLSTCFGNARLARVHAVAEDLGRRWALPVHRGAAGPLDTSTPAVEALCAHRGVVLAIGPLTNIAAALRRGARWSRLIVLGGTTRWGWNVRPLRTTELNFACDLSAASVVLDAGPDIVPMEPCRKVWLRARDLEVLPTWMARRCRSWLAAAPVHSRRRAFRPWDLVASMWLIQPGLFETRRGRFELIRDPFRAGHVHFRDGAGTIVQDVDALGLVNAWKTLCRAADASSVPTDPRSTE
jgi:inosine-uridine nucleoside N-ribohydrolase